MFLLPWEKKTNNRATKTHAYKYTTGKNTNKNKTKKPTNAPSIWIEFNTTTRTSPVLFYNVSSYNYFWMHTEQMSTTTVATNIGFLL